MEMRKILSKLFIRNIKDYTKAAVNVLDPLAFLKLLEADNE